MRGRKNRVLNVEVRIGFRPREVGYRRLHWYIKSPDFQRYLL